MAQSSLRTLNKCLANITDAESGLVRRSDAIVDDRRQVERNVVLGHADLLGYLDNLDLDVDLDKLLGQGVNIDETWVDSAGESTKLGDESNVSLADGLVGVGAHDAAWDGSQSTDAATECVDLELVLMLMLWRTSCA